MWCKGGRADKARRGLETAVASTGAAVATYTPAAVLASLPVLLLSALAFAGASALASRGWERRAERLLAASGIWLGIVLLPIHVLGWLAVVIDAPVLSRTSLAVAISVLSVVALAIGVGRTPRAGLRRIRGALADAVLLPVDGLRECARARSLSLIGLVAVLAMVAWTAWGCWLAPSSAWDGVFYHEAMIGFAIQNGGFAVDDLPPTLAPIAGYPRMAESLSLFFVAFLDRRLIEFPGCPTLLVVLLGAYVVLRRWVPSRATAIGLASGLALLPGLALQLRSTYIDTVACGFFVIALAFSTRAPLRGRDALLSALAIGLVGASKSTGFLLGPAMAAVLFFRILAQVPGAARKVGIATASMAVVLVVFAPTYVRNWIDHENPVWPGRVHYEAIGVDWQGPLDVASHQRSFDDTIAMLFAPPIPLQQYHDTRDNGYGNTPPFVILPLALIALFVAIGRAFRGDRSARWMLVTVLPMLATFVLSPAHYWARLNLHSVVVIWIAAGWLCGRAGRALGEGVVGAVVIGGVMTLWWSEPKWDIPLERVRRLADLAPEERAVSADGIITLMPPEIARERERMTAADVVVFAEHPFPAQLWNERFTNRVLWRAPRGVTWIDDAEALGATWLVVPTHGGLISRLRERDDWEELGPAVRERDVTAFRRRPPAPSEPRTPE